MIAAVLIVLAAACAAAILAPLRRPRPVPPVAADLAALRAARDAALRSLADLELDRATGKVGDADYAALRVRGEAQALDALRALEAVERGTGP